MDKQAKQQMLIDHLQSLADQPQERLDYALHLLERERGIRVVTAALAVLNQDIPREARPVLLKLYDYYEQAPIKRDAGCRLRILILTALEPHAQIADREMAERALKTYEFLPPTREESASGLRIAGLSFLEKLDAELALYHAARLLSDPYTSRMSGEPAITAVRLLAPHRQPLPLYSLLMSNLQTGHNGIAEVMGECLRSLKDAPPSIIDDLLTRYTDSEATEAGPIYKSRDDIELAGLFDMLLDQKPRPASLTFLEDFLHATRSYSLYRYVVALLVASPHPEFRALLLDIARKVRDAHKADHLLSAFALVQHDPQVTQVIKELELRSVNYFSV